MYWPNNIPVSFTIHSVMCFNNPDLFNLRAVIRFVTDSCSIKISRMTCYFVTILPECGLRGFVTKCSAVSKIKQLV